MLIISSGVEWIKGVIERERVRGYEKEEN